jgi:hypothetical protein
MNYSPKRASEVETFGVDFVNLVPAGVTILSAAWTVNVLKGVDANAAAMVVGSPTISGTVVTTHIAGGIADVFYLPRCTAQLSNGDTVVLPEPGRGVLRITA